MFAALAAARLLAGADDARAGPGRFDTLDGLRGLLAFCVFLHHASVWHGWLQGAGWRVPASRLFLHFGEASVAMFFMVTAFLFVGRLLDARGCSIDWLHLYVSRVLRLTPAYLLAMALMFAVLALATLWRVDGAGSGIVQRTWPDILGAAAVWLGFCMLGMPAINAYLDTPMITAGVTWSLPFEWTFYFALPLFALPLRVGMPLPALVLGLANLLWIGAWAPPAHFAWPFVGGIVAAVAVRQPAFVAWARRPLAGALAIGALAAMVATSPTVYAPPALALTTFAFAVIAAGQGLWGLLTNPAVRLLGHAGYSLYLLHGILLYVTWLFVFGEARARELSTPAYWGVIVALAPLLVLVAHASFRRCEVPAMAAVASVTAALRRRVRAHRP